MSDFEKQLQDIIGSETGASPESASISKSASKNKKSTSTSTANAYFSVSSFLKALGLGLVVFCGLATWAYFSANDTALMVQEKLATKTAIVERSDSDVYRMSDIQPIVRMGEAELAENQESSPPSDAANAPILSLESGKGGLNPAPIPGLYETTGAGQLPLPRSEDSLTPFEAYKKPFKKQTDKPLLSVIVSDVGLSKSMTDGVIKNLPPNVTLSFSPYTNDLKTISEEARDAGHEVWLTLPLETKNYPISDPGPSTIMVEASVEQNKSRLQATLGSTVGYAGFVAQKDHVFRQEDVNVNPTFQEIFARGLAIIDSNPGAQSFVDKMASQNDFPHGKNNFWLDDDLSPDILNQRIEQIIEYGNASGLGVILILRPYPASIKALQKFLNSPKSSQFELAPASAQVFYGG